MEKTYQGFYQWHGGPSYNFNNVLLEPLDSTGRFVLTSAFGDPKVSQRFFQGFNRPWELYPMLAQKDQAKAWVQEAAGGSWRAANAKGTVNIIKGQLRQKVKGRHFAYDDEH
jgi:hypothetical protein